WATMAKSARSTGKASVRPLRCSVMISARPSAWSSDLFGHNKMRFRITSVVSIDAAFEFLRTQSPVGLCHRPFAMHPFGLNGIEPRALHGQPAGHDPYAVSCGFHPLIVLAQPGAYRVTLVPRGIIPEQEQRRETLRRQARTAPGQERRGHRAHWTAL